MPSGPVLRQTPAPSEPDAPPVATLPTTGETAMSRCNWLRSLCSCASFSIRIGRLWSNSCLGFCNTLDPGGEFFIHNLYDRARTCAVIHQALLFRPRQFSNCLVGLVGSGQSTQLLGI